MAILTFALLYSLDAAKVRLVDLRAKVLVIGGGTTTLELLEVLVSDPDRPYSIIGIVDEMITANAVAGAPVLGGVNGSSRSSRRRFPILSWSPPTAADRRSSAGWRTQPSSASVSSGCLSSTSTHSAVFRSEA